MRIRLTRKLADWLDGIDVSRYEVGDGFDLPSAEAELLIAEGWALTDRRRSGDVHATSIVHRRAVATDRLRHRTVKQLSRVREEIETEHCGQQERRRAEDRIREELHDARSMTLNCHD